MNRFNAIWAENGVISTRLRVFCTECGETGVFCTKLLKMTENGPICECGGETEIWEEPS